MSEKLLNYLYQFGYIQHFNPGDFLIKENENNQYVFIMLEGVCRVFRYLDNGIEAIIHIQNGFQIYGEVELFSKQLTQTNIQALIPTKCLVIPYSDELRNNLDFNHFCIQQLSSKLNTYDHNHLMNIHYPVETKLATYILCTHQNYHFSANYTHLASYLGCSYRHLVRIFNQLCDKEILIKMKGFYQINNLPYLQQLASDIYKQ